jgi:hypothetical protein
MGHNQDPKDHVLADHTREGKVIRTSLSRLPLRETSWVKQTLPELLWLGLLQGTYDMRRAVVLSLSLAEAAAQVKPSTSNLLWFAATSSYATLEEDHWHKVRRALENSGRLDDIAQAIATLVYFYPECPFAHLLTQSASQPSNEEQAIESFKAQLEPLYGKQERAATLVQATAVYIALVTQKIAIAEGISLGNLEAVKHFPRTEQSQKVAASVRATCNFLIGATLDESESDWALYFWRRGFELGSCEYELPYEL